MGCGGCRFQVASHEESREREAAMSPQEVSKAKKETSTDPEFHQADSSITFPEGVELFEVEGYEVDEDDPRRLVCTMPNCNTRIVGIMLQRNGTYKPHFVCTGDCEHKSKPVTFDICSACPLRSEGGL